MDTFVDEVEHIQAIREKLSPRTETFINEVGCGSNGVTIMQPGYYNLCGATFAYLWAKLALQGIEHVGMSQVIGFTGGSLCDGCADEWPSTSMVNWYTGDGNARYWILQVLSPLSSPISVFALN